MLIADSSQNHDVHLKFDLIQWFVKYDLLAPGSQHLDELTIGLQYQWTKNICQNSMYVIRYQPIPSLLPSIL